MYARDNGTTIDIYGELPKVWNGIINFRASTPTDLAAEGFYPYIMPAYDPNTQKLGDLYFDIGTETFTYPLINLTPTEVDDIALENAKSQASSTEFYLYEEGNRLLLEFKANLRYLYNDGQVTLVEFNAEKTIMNKVYKDLNIGELEIAKDELLSLPVTTSTVISNLRVDLETEIQNAINNI